MSAKKKIKVDLTGREWWLGVWYVEWVVREGPSEEVAPQLAPGWQEASSQAKVWEH